MTTTITTITTAAELAALLDEANRLWADPPCDGLDEDARLERSAAIDREILASRPTDPCALADLIRWVDEQAVSGDGFGLLSGAGHALMEHIADRLEATAAEIDAKTLEVLAGLPPVARGVWLEAGRRLLAGEDAAQVQAWAVGEVERLAAAP